MTLTQPIVAHFTVTAIHHVNTGLQNQHKAHACRIGHHTWEEAEMMLPPVSTHWSGGGQRKQHPHATLFASTTCRMNQVVPLGYVGSSAQG